jgi:hypothetical protein
MKLLRCQVRSHELEPGTLNDKMRRLFCFCFGQRQITRGKKADMYHAQEYTYGSIQFTSILILSFHLPASHAVVSHHVSPL